VEWYEEEGGRRRDERKTKEWNGWEGMEKGMEENLRSKRQDT
jgi:hypothetical protein